MTAKRGPVAAAASVAGRVAARRPLGKLSHRVISPAALRRYNTALSVFFRWVQMSQEGVPPTPTELDSQVCRFIDACWEEGEGRSLVGNVICGLQHRVPALRGSLHGAWRLHAAWGRHELPRRSTPLPLLVLEGMVGLARCWGFHDMALLLALGFHGFLRTGELLDLRPANLHVDAQNGVVVVTLPHTKGTARHGAVEGVSIVHKPTAQACHDVVRRLLPGCLIVQRTALQFRRLFQALLTELRVDQRGFQPYSLRRGGATHHFQMHGNLHETAVMGRWGALKTARV